ILNGQNPSQAAVPCCVHIECGSKQEGRCMNTPVSEDNDCKGALVEDEDRCPEGKSKTMCCIPSSHENVNIEYTKDQMVAVDPGIQSYQGFRDDSYLYEDELWNADSGLFQDGGEGGIDCLAWGINCPVS
ncbi:hypothetical protein MMC31_004236, partial [Peltigera leucophlebia]|nr:hypothetical protein [Peltigera leucophlebia]